MRNIFKSKERMQSIQIKADWVDDPLQELTVGFRLKGVEGKSFTLGQVLKAISFEPMEDIELDYLRLETPRKGE